MNRFALAVSLVLATSAPAFANMQLSEGEIAGLQAAMQSHIDQSSVDGALLALNPADGKINHLYPAKAHPMIMSMGDYYVLCADFRNEAGKDENVNFYVARDADRFVVFSTSVGHDPRVDEMMKMEGSEAAN